ncbi:MAG TPA: hypothetical protein VFE47_02990 [Tepidisphaeraceae bacterium]|jgi:hypothetical protein|nr:hypothetical protein [Tepidisphaeraceae bacterium]
MTEKNASPNIGTLALRRPIGDIVFSLAKASISAVDKDGVIFVDLYVNTKRPPIKGIPHDEYMAARPNAEVTIQIPAADYHSLIGRRFSVPKSWDAALDDHVSCIYCFEHDDLNDNEISFVQRSGNSIKLKWTGTTAEGYCENSNIRVEIEGWFAFEGENSFLEK